jgi:glycosyltransferase involved in cell wall biosynthesis
VQIRVIVRNAYAKGGTARTTLDTASRLAAHHDVEVVSLFRNRFDPIYAVDPRVRVRHLLDRRRFSDLDAMVTTFGSAGRLERGLIAMPSVIEPIRARRDPRLSLLSDLLLAREIRGMREGMLIGTRPSINLAIARFARPSVYALGQEHQYLGLWDPAMRRAISRAYPRLDAVTALTPPDATSYRAILPAGTLVAEIPNAVPCVGSARTDTSSRLVIAVGRLTRQKGFDLLIEAFRIVAAQHPTWSLHIYGAGPRRKELAHQIRSSGLGRTVKLKGFSFSLPEELAKASIFALSSRFEGFSLALVEAMGVGLPPVSFACPHGPPGIITDGVDGLLVPAENVEKLATSICSLIEDPARRAALGAAARVSVQRYSPAVVDDGWERFIQDLTSRPPGRYRRRPGLAARGR